jgi:hypothetical protein
MVDAADDIEDEELRSSVMAAAFATNQSKPNLIGVALIVSHGFEVAVEVELWLW